MKMYWDGPAFVLGGSNTDYPGYGCLSGHNDLELDDIDLAQCQAACIQDPFCKSIDFYVGRTGHTCTVSYSNFVDVGSTTSTQDCRFYEITRAQGNFIIAHMGIWWKSSLHIFNVYLVTFSGNTHASEKKGKFTFSLKIENECSTCMSYKVSVS